MKADDSFAKYAAGGDGRTYDDWLAAEIDGLRKKTPDAMPRYGGIAPVSTAVLTTDAALRHLVRALSEKYRRPVDLLAHRDPFTQKMIFFDKVSRIRVAVDILDSPDASIFSITEAALDAIVKAFDSQHPETK